MIEIVLLLLLLQWIAIGWAVWVVYVAENEITHKKALDPRKNSKGFSDDNCRKESQNSATD